MLKRVGRWIAVSAVALAASCATAAGNPDLPRSYERPALPARTPVPAPVQPASNYGYLPPPPQPLARYSPPPYRPDLVPDADRRASYSYPVPPPSTPTQYAEWSDQDYRYRLGPGDQLALRFLLNPDLNGPATIGPDGRGVFPLVSAVKVADLTAEEANAVLTDAYAQILRRPQVEVLITAYGAAQIYVGGEVRNPGVLPIKGQLTTEQLWDLPLQARSSLDLNTVAVEVNRELKGLAEESFVETRSNPRRGELEIMLEIVKFVIAAELLNQMTNMTTTTITTTIMSTNGPPRSADLRHHETTQVCMFDLLVVIGRRQQCVRFL